MTEKSKRIWKIVGISAGVLTIIGIGIYVWHKQTSKPEESAENEFLPKVPYQAPSQAPKTGTAGLYSKQEIEKMQAWLLATGISMHNQIMSYAITSTGGLDGKIGKGFWTALNEAIKRGYVKNLEELHSITNNT